MKKINTIITNLVLISLVAAIGCITAMAQREVVTQFAEDNRPFDFSDKYYDANGVQPYQIMGRANGTDGKSVFTKNVNEETYRDIRFVETLAAYNYDGSVLYYNNYGELFDTGFNGDASGQQAMEVARAFPMYVFPSATVRASVRQANLLSADEAYFSKNPLGLSLIVEVVYTERKEKDESVQILKDLGASNGYSADGTPIIKTVKEINFLTQMGIVTQKVRGLDTKGEPSYAIVKAIDISKPGAIADDAFLAPVNDTEVFFLEHFECLKKVDSPCLNAGSSVR